MSISKINFNFKKQLQKSTSKINYNFKNQFQLQKSISIIAINRLVYHLQLTTDH